MDVTLILVTLLSLALAAVMTVLAWRLAREERRRSDARVAMLATEMSDASAGRASSTTTARLASVSRAERVFASERGTVRVPTAGGPAARVANGGGAGA